MVFILNDFSSTKQKKIKERRWITGCKIKSVILVLFMVADILKFKNTFMGLSRFNFNNILLNIMLNTE